MLIGFEDQSDDKSLADIANTLNPKIDAAKLAKQQSVRDFIGKSRFLPLQVTKFNIKLIKHILEKTTLPDDVDLEKIGLYLLAADQSTGLNSTQPLENIETSTKTATLRDLSKYLRKLFGQHEKRILNQKGLEKRRESFKGVYAHVELQADLPKFDLIEFKKLELILPDCFNLEISKVRDNELFASTAKNLYSTFNALNIEQNPFSKALVGLLCLQLKLKVYRSGELADDYVVKPPQKCTKPAFEALSRAISERELSANELKQIVDYLTRISVRNREERLAAADTVLNFRSIFTEVEAKNLLSQDSTGVAIIEYLIAMITRFGSVSNFDSKEELIKAVCAALPNENESSKCLNIHIDKYAEDRKTYFQFRDSISYSKVKYVENPAVQFAEPLGTYSFIAKNPQVASLLNIYPSSRKSRVPETIDNYEAYYSDLLEKLKVCLQMAEQYRGSRNKKTFEALVLKPFLYFHIDFSNDHFLGFLKAIESAQLIEKTWLDEFINRWVVLSLRERCFDLHYLNRAYKQIETRLVRNNSWESLQTNETFLKVKQLMEVNFEQMTTLIKLEGCFANEKRPLVPLKLYTRSIIRFYRTFKDWARVREFFEAHPIINKEASVEDRNNFFNNRILRSLTHFVDDQLTTYIRSTAETRNNDVWNIVMTEALQTPYFLKTMDSVDGVYFICLKYPQDGYSFDSYDLRLFMTDCSIKAFEIYLSSSQRYLVPQLQPYLVATAYLEKPSYYFNPKFPFKRLPGYLKVFFDTLLAEYFAPLGTESRADRILDEQFLWIGSTGAYRRRILIQQALRYAYDILIDERHKSTTYDTSKFAKWLLEKTSTLYASCADIKNEAWDLTLSKLASFDPSVKQQLITFELACRPSQNSSTIAYLNRNPEQFTTALYRKRPFSPDALQEAQEQINYPCGTFNQVVAKVHSHGVIAWRKAKEQYGHDLAEFFKAIQKATGDNLWIAVEDCWTDPDYLPIILATVITRKSVSYLSRFAYELRQRFGSDAVQKLGDLLQQPFPGINFQVYEDEGNKKSKEDKALTTYFQGGRSMREVIENHIVELSELLNELTMLRRGFWTEDLTLVRFVAIDDEAVKQMQSDKQYYGLSFGQLLDRLTLLRSRPGPRDADLIQLFADLLVARPDLADCFAQPHSLLVRTLADLGQDSSNKKLLKGRVTFGKSERRVERPTRRGCQDEKETSDPFGLASAAAQFDGKKSQSVEEAAVRLHKSSHASLQFYLAELARKGLVEKLLPLLATEHLSLQAVVALGSNLADFAGFFEQLLKLVHSSEQHSNGYLLLNQFKKIEFRPTFDGDLPAYKLPLHALAPSLARLGLQLAVFCPDQPLVASFLDRLLAVSETQSFVLQGAISVLPILHRLQDVPQTNQPVLSYLQDRLASEVHSHAVAGLNPKPAGPVIGKPYLDPTKLLSAEDALLFSHDSSVQQQLLLRLQQDCSALLDKEQTFLTLEDKRSSLKAKVSRPLLDALLRRSGTGQAETDGLQALDRLVVALPKLSRDLYSFHHYWMTFLRNRKPDPRVNPLVEQNQREQARLLQEQRAADAKMTFTHLELRLFGETFDATDESLAYLEVDADFSNVSQCVKRVTYQTGEGWTAYDIHKTAHSSYFALLDDLADLRFASRDLDVFDRPFLEDCIRLKKSPFSIEALGRLSQTNREKLCFSVDTERKANNSYNRRLLVDKLAQWRIEDLLKKFEQNYSYGNQDTELVYSADDMQAEINFDI